MAIPQFEKSYHTATANYEKALTALEKARKAYSKAFTTAKPSQVLRMALADLIAVEKNPRYRIDMGSWVDPSCDGERCEVCFGGAVLANRFGMKEFSGGQEELIDIFNGDNEPACQRIHSLDEFRTGLYEETLRDRYGDNPKVLKLLKNEKFTDKLRDLENYHVCYDFEGAKPFKAAMKKLADFLENNGI